VGNVAVENFGELTRFEHLAKSLVVNE